jgi:putative SOS response-associated peptidase YedK
MCNLDLVCGRYAISKLPEELIEEFEISAGHTGKVLPADWNISPTKEIYIIRNNQEEKRELVNLSWGLIAPWSKTSDEAIKSQSSAINARTETVDSKPTFKNAFKYHRCLIPATGYYEWATELGKYPSKQPFYIHNKNNKTLAFAGIYSTWHDENGVAKQSAALITRPAVDILEKIHHRMPTFLPQDRWDHWLDNQENDVDEIKALLQFNNEAAGLIADPVSTKVNATRNNGPELIQPIELGEPQTLF